jgi:hypothetical protein
VGFTISKSAKTLIQGIGITDVTFKLVEIDIRGAMGIIKEIRPFYQAPADASGYKYFREGNFSVFIDREIMITGPLILKTSGFLNKKLALSGAKAPFFNFEKML